MVPSGLIARILGTEPRSLRELHALCFLVQPGPIHWTVSDLRAHPAPTREMFGQQRATLAVNLRERLCSLGLGSRMQMIPKRTTKERCPVSYQSPPKSYCTLGGPGHVYVTVFVWIANPFADHV